MSWIKFKRTELFISSIVILIGVFHIGLPIYLDFILSVLIAKILNNWKSALITSFGLFIGIAIINLTFVAEIDYRAHEMLSRDKHSYEPNQHLHINQPFGDLFAIAGQKDEFVEIVEPREIEFVTDSEGYRNRSFNLNPSYILVGDSFVVGNGTTQSNTLSESMNNLLAQDTYSLAYPGAPEDYEFRMRNYDERLGGGRNVLLFYFEGNDFIASVSNVDGISKGQISQEGSTHINILRNLISRLETLKSTYLDFIYPKSFKFSRVVNRQSLRSYTWIKDIIFKNSGRVPGSPITVEEIGGLKVGFLNAYRDVSNAENVDTYLWSDEKLVERLHYVFFIPTKYRVYHELNANIPLQVLSSGYSELGVEVIDLTPILKNGANHQAKDNELLFWRDDTHWNGAGISLVASYITEELLAAPNN